MSKTKKLSPMSYRKVTKKLKKAGFVLRRQCKGSHEIWKYPTTRRTTSVPRHARKDIPAGTLKAIIKQTGLDVEEFLEL